MLVAQTQIRDMYGIRLRTQSYLDTRRNHAAWQLLAARNAPLILGCLRTLFTDAQDGVEFEIALQALAELLGEYANTPELQLGDGEIGAQARKELRSWIGRRLIIEREGRLYATDALEAALNFIDGLDARLMTSTASRLSVVQREIENLEIRLNPDPALRSAHLRNKIAELERELARIEAGDIDVLTAEQSVEGIREIYNLATGLRADFRRVEDSYREADRHLRESIIASHSHRGAILDELLDGHDTLLETPEGQVFHGFFQQLTQGTELAASKQRLRTIIAHPATDQALSDQQKSDLRWLFIRLTRESETVLRARERSERDVRGFLKSGLITEHHRVGELLDELLRVALNVDWSSHKIRDAASGLPPVAPATNNLPLVERLRFKSLDVDDDQDLELSQRSTDLTEIEDDFWLTFDSLDRHALFADTRELLQRAERPMGIAEIAAHLPPRHDLESIAFWLGLAREAQVPIHAGREALDITDHDGHRVRFNVPRVELNATALDAIDWEL